MARNAAERTAARAHLAPLASSHSVYVRYNNQFTVHSRRFFERRNLWQGSCVNTHRGARVRKAFPSLWRGTGHLIRAFTGRRSPLPSLPTGGVAVPFSHKCNHSSKKNAFPNRNRHCTTTPRRPRCQAERRHTAVPLKAERPWHATAFPPVAAAIAPAQRSSPFRARCPGSTSRHHSDDAARQRDSRQWSPPVVHATPAEVSVSRHRRIHDAPCPGARPPFLIRRPMRPIPVRDGGQRARDKDRASTIRSTDTARCDSRSAREDRRESS